MVCVCVWYLRRSRCAAAAARVRLADVPSPAAHRHTYVPNSWDSWARKAEFLQGRHPSSRRLVVVVVLLLLLLFSSSSSSSSRSPPPARPVESVHPPPLTVGRRSRRRLRRMGNRKTNPLGQIPVPGFCARVWPQSLPAARESRVVVVRVHVCVCL